MTDVLSEYGPLYDEIDNLKAINADLLAALEELLDQLEGLGISDWHGAEGLSLEQARTTIVKARRESCLT